MNKTWLIMRYEMVTMLSSKGYLLLSFGVPIFAFLIFTVVQLIQDNAAPAAPEVNSDSGAVEIMPPLGFVDHSGVITALPADITHLAAYADEASALAAVETGAIEGYFIVPAGYIADGKIIYVDPDASIAGTDLHTWVIHWVLLVNLVGGDEALAGRIWNPADLQETVLLPAGQTAGDVDGACLRPGFDCETNAVVRYLPLIMVVLFFLFINTSAGMLMGSVSNEKKNRVMEVLLSSVTPAQMLTGKVIGVGLLSFVQVFVWVGSGSLLLRSGGAVMQLPAGFVWPWAILGWGMVFFVLGYAIYAGLMAGAGALVPDVKESGQVAWIMSIPLFVGYLSGIFLIGATDEPIAIALSLFPLTAPVVMMMRLTMGTVPVWQLLLAALLLLATAVFVIRTVARMFRAAILLSGQPFTLRRYVAALRARGVI